MTDPTEDYVVEFECWSCLEEFRLRLNELQQDRVEIAYQEIVPDAEKPKRYHVSCPNCRKFNTVYL